MLFSAFILGLVGSLHCIGMCGPIAAIVPGGNSNTPANKLVKAITYNFGRVTIYGLMGLLIGYFGKNLHLFGLQQSLSIGIGILILLGLFFPIILKKLNPNSVLFSQVNRLKSYIIPQLNKKSVTAPLIIGLLNGLLPCGLVYLALAGALVLGEPFLSTQYMLLFGLGTLPALLSISITSSLMVFNFRKTLLKFVPIIIFTMGTLFIVRGMNLGIPYLSPKINSNQKITCH